MTQKLLYFFLFSQILLYQGCSPKYFQTQKENEDLKKQIEQLTQERDNLLKERKELISELIKVTDNNNNRIALFVTSISTSPKTTLKGNDIIINKIAVNFTLSRLPQPQENLVIKLFDSKNKEIFLTPQYRNYLNNASIPTAQKIFIEPENYKFTKGSYSVYIYLTNVEKGIAENEIGRAEFILK